jgi:hypothetical protein
MHAVASSMPSVDDALRSVGSSLTENLHHFVLEPIEKTRHLNTYSSAFWTWIYLLLLFQLFLATVEHLRYWTSTRCLPLRKRWKATTRQSHQNYRQSLPIAVTHVSNHDAVPWHDTPQNTMYGRFKTILFFCSGLAPLRLFQCVFLFVVGVICINISNIVPLRLWRRFWLFLVRVQIYLILGEFLYLLFKNVKCKMFNL